MQCSNAEVWKIFYCALIWIAHLEEEATAQNQEKFVAWLMEDSLHLTVYRHAVHEIAALGVRFNEFNEINH